MASYTAKCYDHKSVTFSFTGLSSGNSVRIVFRPTSTSYLLYSVSWRAYSSTLTVTIPDDLDSAYSYHSGCTFYDNGCEAIDLTPETSYVGRVYLYATTAEDAASGSNTDLGSCSFTTTAKAEVEEWSWTTTNGPMYLATAAQTRKAYTAITTNGYLTDFSYLVWNDLVYKTNEVITDRSGSWNTTYGTLSQTLMTSSDKVMTAKRFNAVWWNLAQYVSTGLSSARVTGGTIMGNYFVLLATAVNNAIWRG